MAPPPIQQKPFLPPLDTYEEPVPERFGEDARLPTDAAYTREHLISAKSYLTHQEVWKDFLGAWYSSQDNSVRVQLYEQLKERSPTFSMPFISSADLASTSRLLGRELSATEIRAESPQCLSDLFKNLQGQGAMETSDEAPFEHKIIVGAFPPETIKQDGQWEEISSQIDSLIAPGTLGQVLVHEEIHIRTGEPHATLSEDDFHTAESAMEVPTVLYDLLMVTDAYHDWRKSNDASYSYRSNPTNVVLRTPNGSMHIDPLYQEARERFKVFEDDGVDRFLEMLDRPETKAFLNKLIWGHAVAPTIR